MRDTINSIFSSFDALPDEAKQQVLQQAQQRYGAGVSAKDLQDNAPLAAQSARAAGLRQAGSQGGDGVNLQDGMDYIDKMLHEEPQQAAAFAPMRGTTRNGIADPIPVKKAMSSNSMRSEASAEEAEAKQGMRDNEAAPADVKQDKAVVADARGATPAGFRSEAGRGVASDAKAEADATTASAGMKGDDKYAYIDEQMPEFDAMGNATGMQKPVAMAREMQGPQMTPREAGKVLSDPAGTHPPAITRMATQIARSFNGMMGDSKSAQAAAPSGAKTIPSSASLSDNYRDIARNAMGTNAQKR